MKRIADSTVRRLSAYLRFLEDFEQRGLTTISSEELAKRGHKLKEVPASGKVNLLVRTGEGIDAAAEPRSPSQPAGY